MSDHAVPVADGRVLLFRLAGRVYGCSLSAVREIIPWRHATRLPGAPAFVSGLINLRGSIVTVVHLGRRLGVSEEIRGDGSIILVELGTKCMGFEVDEVMDVQPLATEHLESANEATLAGGENIRGVVRGMGHLGDAVVTVLDIGTLVGQILL